MTSLKKTVYEIIEEAAPGNRASEIFDVFLITLIALNVVALIVGTVEEVHRISPGAFQLFEIASVGIFTVEYLLRVWTSTENPSYAHPVKGRLKYLVSPLALIDLLAVLPVYLVFFVNLRGLDLRFLRVMRLLARIVRLGRYFSSLRTLGNIVHTRRGELAAVVSVLFLLLVMTSSLMFFAEHQAQPEEFASIPRAMWWSIITLTTVGYGDVFPVTAAGRLLAGVIAIVGIGLFALPAGILGSGFMEELAKEAKEPVRCPHCGEVIDEATDGHVV
ncbi:MAG: ion transporter [Caldilineaceae bacterium SB0665_bin_25]|nr:ion transporter [Caldilineaceae bacterium SB0665_bin_25]